MRTTKGMRDAAPIPARDREIRERVERCIATLVYYHKDGWSWTGAGLIMEEAQGLSNWAAMMGAGEEATRPILTRLEAEILGRFGPEDGTRLCQEFRRALAEVRNRAH